MSEDRPSVRSSVCPHVRPSVSPLSVCQPGPFVRPLNKEGTAHNESQYWQANSNACNDSGQRRRLIRAERQPQSQGFIRWTVDSGHWTVDSRPWTVDGGHGTSTMGRPSETKQIKSPGRRVAQWLTIETAHGQVNYFAYIYYNLWNSSIVDRRNVVVADRWSWIGLLLRLLLLLLLPCIIVNQVEQWRGGGPSERLHHKSS